DFTVNSCQFSAESSLNPKMSSTGAWIENAQSPAGLRRCHDCDLLHVLQSIPPVISFGRGAPSTILGGVKELLLAGMWPLALLVFFASITAPVLKLVGLIGLLTSVHRRSSLSRLDRSSGDFRDLPWTFETSGPIA